MGRNHLRQQMVPKDPIHLLPVHANLVDHRVLASVSRGYPRLAGSLITCYSPVRHFTRPKTFTYDLHASSTPPTFVLSQDQTLHLLCCECSSGIRIMVARSTCNLDTLLSEGSVETTCATGSRLRIRVQRTNPRLSGMSKIVTSGGAFRLRGPVSGPSEGRFRE